MRISKQSCMTARHVEPLGYLIPPADSPRQGITRSLKIYPVMQSHVPKIFVHVRAGIFLSVIGEDGTEEPSDRLHDSLLL
jgi:hypothetical protein